MNSVEILAATGTNPIVPNWWDTLLVLLGFAVLMFFVFKVVVPKFEQLYAERTEAIEGGMAKAEKAQAEAKAALEHYQKQLADARGEANTIREQAREQGAQILADFKEKATFEATRITEQAHQAIAAERQAALTSLRSEVGALATDLAGRIVGESLADDARSQRVFERFLAELEAQEPAR